MPGEQRGGVDRETVLLAELLGDRAEAQRFDFARAMAFDVKVVEEAEEVVGRVSGDEFGEDVSHVFVAPGEAVGRGVNTGFILLLFLAATFEFAGDGGDGVSRNHISAVYRDAAGEQVAEQIGHFPGPVNAGKVL